MWPQGAGREARREEGLGSLGPGSPALQEAPLRADWGHKPACHHQGGQYRLAALPPSPPGVQSSLAAGRAEGQLLPPWTVRLSVEGAPCGPVNADCLAPSHARHPYLRETGALHLVYPQAPLQQELIS